MNGAFFNPPEILGEMIRKWLNWCTHGFLLLQPSYFVTKHGTEKYTGSLRAHVSIIFIYAHGIEVISII